MYMLGLGVHSSLHSPLDVVFGRDQSMGAEDVELVVVYDAFSPLVSGAVETWGCRWGFLHHLRELVLGTRCRAFELLWMGFGFRTSCWWMLERRDAVVPVVWWFRRVAPKWLQVVPS